MTEPHPHLYIVPGKERLVRDEDRPRVEPPDDDDLGGQLEPMVYEGELLEPDEDEEPPQRLPARIVGKVIATRPPARAVTAGRGVLGAALTLLQGWQSWLMRAWNGLTLGTYRRQVRAAEAAGDREALADWSDRFEKAKARRQSSLLNLPHVVLGLVKLAFWTVAGMTVLVVVVAIVAQLTGAGSAEAVIVGAVGVVRWLISAAGFIWTVLPAGVLVVVVVGGWREGKRRNALPGWLVAEEDDDTEGRDVIPDEGAILNALRHLAITPLNKAFKEGWRPRFVLATGRDGKGYRTQLQLPPGVTVEMINLKKKVLAHNLVRLPIEVWPTEPKNQPGVLDLWVADQGFLTRPVAPWPLLTEGVCDYFKGVPLAVNIRGTTVSGRLSEANYAIAGQMGSGKSTLIITLLLGAILDVLVDIDVFVFAVNADYDPLKPRLRTLLTGTGEEVVEACLDTLREAYDDLSVRGEALKEHGERAVNRRLAEMDPRLRPRIIVIDECQALYMHPEYGEEAVDLTVKLVSAARKYGITVIFATPEPSSTSMPRKVMAVTSNKACFSIGDQRSNDAILGTGSYKSGISAVSLDPKTVDEPGDVGTCMARGFESKPGLLRCYFVAKTAGLDEVTPVVQRALALRRDAEIEAAGREEAGEARDLLADIAAVLGSEPIPVADLPALLARHAPRWAPYKTVNGKRLRAQLADLGVQVPSTGNRWPVSPALIHDALARRDADEDDVVS